MKPALTEAYQQYQSNPNVETYEVFGVELLRFMKAMLRTRYRGNYDKIEDALGEASIRVLSKLDTFKAPIEKFPSWVMTIAFNEASRIGHHDLNRSQQDDSEYEALEHSHSAVDAKLDVQRVVETLSQVDQNIVQLKLEGYEDSEIAVKMNITLPTLWNRWARIKDKFRTQLGGENG